MTVCVGIKVQDCIVFAADSAISIVSTSGTGISTVWNIWRHGLKVFNLHKDLPIVAMTAGMGNFGSESISNLAKDLRIKLSRGGNSKPLDVGDYTIEDVVNTAQEYFRSKYEALDPRPIDQVFEFRFGGYGARDARGEIWGISVVDGTVQPPQQIVSPEDKSRVVWNGQGQAISRLLLGFDHNLHSTLAEHGMAEVEVQSLIEKLQERAMTPLVDPSMPVQDAINLADYLVDVTKRYFAFVPGADIVGGDTDIATVTKHEGFKWIKRKHYYPADLNPKETGHVE